MGAFSSEITAPVTELVIPRSFVVTGYVNQDDVCAVRLSINALLKWEIGFRQSVLTNEKDEFILTKSLQVIIFLEDETLLL